MTVGCRSLRSLRDRRLMEFILLSALSRYRYGRLYRKPGTGQSGVYDQVDGSGVARPLVERCHKCSTIAHRIVHVVCVVHYLSLCVLFSPRHPPYPFLSSFPSASAHPSAPSHPPSGPFIPTSWYLLRLLVYSQAFHRSERSRSLPTSSVSTPIVFE